MASELQTTHKDLLELRRTTRECIQHIARQAIEGIRSTQKGGKVQNAPAFGMESEERIIRQEFNLPNGPVPLNEHGFRALEVAIESHVRQKHNKRDGSTHASLPSEELVVVGIECPEDLRYDTRSRQFDISTSGLARYDSDCWFTEPKNVKPGFLGREKKLIEAFKTTEGLRRNYSVTMLGALATTTIVADTLFKIYDRITIDNSALNDLIGEWRKVHPKGEGMVWEGPHGRPFYTAFLLADSPGFNTNDQ